jgi:hypothetical protein
MTDGTHPRQTEIMPKPRDEYLAAMFRAIRLGASGRIPMGKVAQLTSAVEEARYHGTMLPACTAQLHRGTEDLLAQYDPPPAVSTAPAPSAAEQVAGPPSPPEPPGQAGLAL